MHDAPNIRDAADVIDDVTPSSRNEDTITLSAARWAMHRYAMACLMAVIVVIVGVAFGFYLWDRSSTAKALTDLQHDLGVITGRTEFLERTQSDVMTGISGMRSDIRALSTEVTATRQDVAVLKAGMKP